MSVTANEADVHVGRRVRQCREALGISQVRLARHLGLTFSQVQKYERGANRIGAGRLYLIAAFLKVPVQYFFEGLDDIPAPGGATTQPQDDEAELRALNDAFVSIADPETRRSLLALVCSLASSADRAGRPKVTWLQPGQSRA